MRYGIAASCGLAMFVLSSNAMANCSTAGFRFFVDQNDSVAASSTTTNGQCVHRFTAGGQLTLNSASIVARPQNGTLSQSGQLEFTYRARAGFKGSDRYSIRVCGQNRGGSGCSTINYTMSVQ